MPDPLNMPADYGKQFREAARDLGPAGARLVGLISKALKHEAGWTFEQIGNLFHVTKAQARVDVLGKEFVYRGKLEVQAATEDAA